MKILDANNTLYESYFSWRREHHVEFRNPLCICEITRQVAKHKRLRLANERHQSVIFNAFNEKDGNENSYGEAEDKIAERGLLVSQPSILMEGKRIKNIGNWWHDGACAVP